LLILTRNPSERIIIDDEIEIEILEVKGRQVKFGITAPLDVTVHRGELYKKLKELAMETGSTVMDMRTPR